MGGETRPERGGWEAFMEMERQRLQQHASGKMGDALRHALPGESREELDRIALEDQRLAQRGLVRLRTDEGFHHKHIDEMTRENRKARIAAERETVAWLNERVERSKRDEPAPPIPTHLR